MEDVAALIAEAGRVGGEELFDAIVLDLYEGPRRASQAREDPFYGPAALAATRAALTRAESSPCGPRTTTPLSRSA